MRLKSNSFASWNLRSAVVVTVLMVLVVLPMAGHSQGLTQGKQEWLATATPQAQLVSQDLDSLEDEIFRQIKANETVLGFVIFDVEIDEIEVSEDGSWALAWLSFRDRETGQPIPTEPGLALARRDATGWTVRLQADPQWLGDLDEVPADLMAPGAKTEWKEQLSGQLGIQATSAISGYLLPWAEGQSIYLTRSISHGIGGSMHYAFDFAKPGYPSDMFAVYAARSGFVRYAVWTYPNGYYDGTCGHSNYLVLEDPSTSPTTYALYLHLAQNSIPPEFRQKGAYVARGQFLGMADDTGCSTGNHLHFMVHTNPNSYWGGSVDITFDDVDINGGRPRTPPEANNYPQYGSQGRYLYVSQNTINGDNVPPEGGLTSPKNGARVTGSSVQIKGWARDGWSGLSLYQVVAKYGGSWHDVGRAHNSPTFTQSWNMCSSGVPPGPVSLALNVWDRAGNLAAIQGIAQVTFSGNCPSQPPACSPGPSQVALFSEPNFGGACQVYNPGDYPDPNNLGALANNQAESVWVGSSSQVTLYSRGNFQGRGETLFHSDRNLDDNLIRASKTSSLRVSSASVAPAIPRLQLPASGATLDAFEETTITWQNTRGATEYMARLSGPGGTVTTGWLSDTYWHEPGQALGSLAPGQYQWRVKARNPAGESPWSAWRAFTVTAPGSNPPAAVSAPFNDNMESGSGGWTASGLWQRRSDPNLAHGGSYAWWYGQSSSGTYNTGAETHGNLTSVPVRIPAAGYQLRFWYRYDSEGPGTHWDRRLVQISVDGGPFTTVAHLTDDVANFWLQSPVIDLGAYQNKTIRVRFRFETLDAEDNSHDGWIIDDLSITKPNLQACTGGGEPDDLPSQARAISFGAQVAGQICQAGDVDYYRFSGSAGDRIVVDMDAESLGSSLDTHIFLYDGDGRTLLASHDDEIAYQVRDSHLGYQLPATGTYFVKVRAWDHPSVGGPSYHYKLSLDKDNQAPVIAINSPQSKTFLPSGNVTIQTAASDNKSGLRQVDFYWHPGDWVGSDWKYLGSDRDGQNGWSYPFDTAALADQPGLALYVRAFDWAGNQSDALAWLMTLDTTPPQSSLASLNPVQGSTAFELLWTASDNISGIDRFNIQYRLNSNPWKNYQLNLPGYADRVWFVGSPNNLYAFRMQARDIAGNTESYPPAEETITLVPDCSAPDSFEADDGSGAARNLQLRAKSQAHNFCKPGLLGESDWLAFNAVNGTHYRVFAAPTGPSAAVSITVYAPNGTTKVADYQAAEYGSQSILGWTARRTGTHFIKLEHFDSRVAGDQVGYLVWIREGYDLSFPDVRR